MARKATLTLEEIRNAFAGKAGESFPEILSPAQLASLVGLSVKTIYEWISRGRLDGAFRKRGKHNLIWRDHAIYILFNGTEWSSKNAE